MEKGRSRSSADTFDERTDKQFKALIERYEKEKEELYAQIGRLTIELRRAYRVPTE